MSQALVIDDSKAMRSILRGILQEIGYAVVEAGNGNEALDRFADSPRPDVVLVDWNMPRMDGLEFVGAVRADERYKHLRLVMVTTETEPSRMARALLSGVDEFVMKPFTRDILVEKLRLIGAPIGMRATC